MQNITVDFSQITGKIKPMHSVNNGPAGSKTRGTSGNFAFYEAAKIPMARNHDASFYSGYGGEHTVDVHRIFKRFERDENDPASYDFSATDKYVASCYAAGTEVFYRLGASIEHGTKYGTYPPADFAKWARICEHIIRHYNEGWADGYHYGIKYWEIWNEADCRNADGSNPCWQGTDEQFVELFCTTIQHLKACFPELKIGGPAFCGTWNDYWNELLFSEMKKRGLPLDFFSFHGYSTRPRSYTESALKARGVMDKYGYPDAEIILNEWNYVRAWRGEEYKKSRIQSKRIKGASFIAGSMIAAEQSPMDHFMYYDARPGAWCGMFNTDTLEPLKGYYPFPMFSELYAIGGEVKSETSDDNRLYALAAKNDTEAAMMLTYFDDPDDAPAEMETTLKLVGLDGRWKLTMEVLDEEHDRAVIREDILTGGMETILRLPIYSVYFLRLAKI
ncbi:MAG: hypothetical protein E7632_12975 [Ruminococcaceae bacterium]|nr:hypothetical protein [Oscillospiraceae bacterium]